MFYFTCDRSFTRATNELCEDGGAPWQLVLRKEDDILWSRRTAIFVERSSDVTRPADVSVIVHNRFKQSVVSEIGRLKCRKSTIFPTLLLFRLKFGDVPFGADL